MKQISTIAALSVVGLLACEPVLQPEANSPNFHPVGGRIVLRSVKGNGFFDTDRRFDFSALEYADGTFTGAWSGTNPTLGLRGRGPITCFTIVGNAAWIGGLIEAFLGDPGRVGQDVVWRVVDNGHGADAAPDQISRSFIRVPGGASIHCLNTPNLALNDVDAGDIQVRER